MTPRGWPHIYCTKVLVDSLQRNGSNLRSANSLSRRSPGTEAAPDTGLTEHERRHSGLARRRHVMPSACRTRDPCRPIPWCNRPDLTSVLISACGFSGKVGAACQSILPSSKFEQPSCPAYAAGYHASRGEDAATLCEGSLR